MSANGFSREMEMHYEDAYLDEQPATAEKNTIESRLGADVVAKLRALRDGGSN